MSSACNVSKKQINANRTIVVPKSIYNKKISENFVLHISCGNHQTDSGLLSIPNIPMSCALSDNRIVTYDLETLTLIHSINKAHNYSITGLCHASISEKNVIMSSGKDGLLCIYDLRQNSSISISSFSDKNISQGSLRTKLPSNEQALSFSLGYGETLAAVGSDKGRIHFFDIRQLSSNENECPKSRLGLYADAHSEEVTKVRFQTIFDGVTTTSLLASASEDGLACVHDTSKPSEESALESIINAHCPLRDIGFFGNNGEGLYCLTGSETMSLWYHNSLQCLRNFDYDIRSYLSACTKFPINYLIGCHWDYYHSDLLLSAGNSEGNIAVFRVEPDSLILRRSLIGGHNSCVRVSTLYLSSFLKPMQRILTGGEDSKICEWLID